MKILLDENVPTKVKYDFGASFETYTVKDMGWLGKKNGELLGLAVFNSFDIFLTLDKNLIFQQSINKFDLKFIILIAVDNKHQTLQPYMQKVKELLHNPTIPKISEVTID
jgi:predicted nuclease of predicted toxin-antitoxin system